MKHRCRQCDYVADGPGNCPTCNIPMEVLQQTEEQNQPGVTPDVPAEGAPEANPETTGTPETPVAPEEPVAPEAPAEGDGNPPSEEGGEV